MVGCIITGHGDFAQGLISALEMIAGPQNATQAVIFHEDEAATFGNSLTHAIDEAIEQFGSVLVCCDLMGGTPFNQAMLAAADKPVEIVTGCNLGMLLELTSSQSSASSAQELAQIAQVAGKESVAHISPSQINTHTENQDSLDLSDEGDGI